MKYWSRRLTDDAALAPLPTALYGLALRLQADEEDAVTESNRRTLEMWLDDEAFLPEFRAELELVLADERRAMVERIEQRVSKWPKDAALEDFLEIVREAGR